jgi:hypothetical protein
MVCQKVELITKYSFWAARHPFSYLILFKRTMSHESTAKGGIHAKRLKAGWNNNYLSLVLNSLSP